MIITSRMRNAIILAAGKLGGQAKLARISGVSQQNISRYISGHVQNVTPAIWTRLLPSVGDYLPPEQREAFCDHPDCQRGDAARVDRAIAALGGGGLIGWDNRPAWPDLAAKWMRIALDDGVDALYRAILDCPEFNIEVRVRLAAAVAERVAK